jgi:hypothetical protein
MVLVSHRYKFIHIRNFKVASSSIESFFGQFCVDPAIPYVFKDLNEQIISPYGIIGSISYGKGVWHHHISAKHIKEEIGDEIFTSYTKFCVIRNPYDIVVSAYHWASNMPPFIVKDFKTFCRGYKLNYNSSITNKILLDDTPVCDYYIRYENLKEDIIMVLERLGITEYDINDLPNHKSNIRPKRPYQEYYDDETRAIVAELFKTEIEMFGYTF